MNMNEEGKKNYSFIIILSILSIVIIGIIIFSISNNTKKKEKPLTIDVTTTSKIITTTTTEVIKPIVVTNFTQSLDKIDVFKNITGTTDKVLEYSGARFNYKCSEANENNCTRGSLTMNVGTAMLPIYLFNDDASNYGLRPQDIFISVNDNNIVLTYNDVHARIKIYSRMGQYVGEINDAILYYNINDRKLGPSYPSISETVSYHACVSNKVVMKVVNINNINEIVRSIDINGANCN